MIHETFNGKKVIWESKLKQIAIIVISFAFVAIAIWTRSEYSSFSFGGTIVLFGGGGVIMLVRLLNPKNIFVTHKSELGKRILAERIKKQQEDLGFFLYDETGFKYDDQNKVMYHKWADIKSIFGYKEDRYTTDKICVDLFTSDGFCIKLTEDTPGWYQFNKKLTENFLTISNNWEGDIIYPAFKSNLTLLFDKAGRSKAEAEADCYKL